MSPTSLAELIDHGGSNTALIYRDRPISIGELADLSRRLAGGLKNLGIGAGDRIALWMPNVPAYLGLLFACARLGAIAVSVNTRFRAAEVGDIISRSGAKALVLWPGFLGVPFLDILKEVEPARLAGIETVVVYGEEGEAIPGLPFQPKRIVAYDTLAATMPLAFGFPEKNTGFAIFTTSGTTKAPKFVLQGQQGVAAHGFNVARGFGYLDPDTVMLQALPLCGVFGFTQAMAGLAARKPMVMMPAFEPLAAADLIRRYKVTAFNGTDDMIHRLLETSKDQVPFPTLTEAGYAAFNAALADLPSWAEKRGLRLFGLYGMSEVHALFSRFDPTLPLALRQRAGGVPVSPDYKVRTRDPESGVLLPHGQAGELEFRGASVMLEYFNDPEATQGAFTEDGYIKSGDLGETLAEGGFLFLTRMGDVLRLAGFLVSPAEIEATVQELPGIEGAQAVAVGTKAGTKAVVFVVLKPGATLDEAATIAHCRKRIANYKVPHRVVALEAFPTTASANGTKIQRTKLRDMAQGMRETAG